MMETIDFKVTFNFFQNSIKRMIQWLEENKTLSELFEADIYGGSLKSYGDELGMWGLILNNNEKLDILTAFIGDIIEPKSTSETSLIYYTDFAKTQQPIGKLVENTSEKYSLSLNTVCKYVIVYPKGKDKYEYIWEILCS